MSTAPAIKIQQLILALAEGESSRAWAMANDVSVRTANRWAADPRVKAQVNKIRKLILDEAIGRLVTASRRAANTLVALTGDEHPPGIRLGAARAILADLISVESHASLAEELVAVKLQLAELTEMQGRARRPKVQNGRGGLSCPSGAN